MTMSDRPRTTAREVAAFLLATKRDREIKVRVNDTLVAVADVYYDREADTIIIELDEESLDYQIAIGTDPAPLPRPPT